MIQFITDGNSVEVIIDQARKALAGGVRWIQLRMKDATPDEIKSVASVIVPMCHETEATVIVDDHVELVEACGFDGVHLGKCDMDPRKAREILGSDRIIGFTVNSADDAMLAKTYPIDYVGVGPFRFTSTKKKLAEILGIEGISEIIKILGREIPSVVIGGITVEDIAVVKSAGACGVAVSGAIAHAGDVQSAADTFVKTDIEGTILDN
ncbi:thiamine phosphate synthase [uncultured Duncaniella sp.]|uniref:thiamine phosphate synthase n=1 Tax=uncultured Duncaniella sp. TaxID=2768039 RepID=UPI0026E10661|nr:thiamine phosphate synthase [uncultured Duncaniella sp.]